MQTVGIDIDDQLKIAFVTKKKKNFKIECKEIPIGSESVKHLYKKNTCSGLSANEFILKKLEIPTTNQKVLEKTLLFQISTLSHLKDPINFPLPIKKEKNTSYFSVFTTSKQTLKSHLNVFKEIFIDPDFVSTVPSALLEFIKSNSTSKEGIILDVSRTKTTLVYFKDLHVNKSFFISSGSDDLLPVKLPKKKVDLLSLSVEKNRSLDTFIKKLKSVFYSLDKKPLNLFLTGDHNTFDFLPFLEATFSDWISSITVPKNSKFAIAIGLAFERSKTNCIQFRQKDFYPKKWLKSLLFKYCSLLIFSMLGSGSLYIYKSKLFNEEEARITQIFDQRYRESVENTEKASFSKKYAHWNKELKKGSLPFLFSGPNLSDCLLFLDNHPLTSQIDITKIDYKLVSFPKLGASSDPYKIQVKLEIKASKAVARKFFEDLSKNSSFVDQSQKCGWKNLENSYLITFFCKPSTKKML